MEGISTTSRRMGNALQSASTYNKIYKDGDERRRTDATVLRQLAGARPFSDSALREAGQSWRTNLNFRDASSALEQVLVGYWRLVHDTQNMAHFRVDSKTPHAADFEQIFQKNFNRFYSDWGVDYVTQYLRLSFNHTTFGVGPLVYRDQDSPRYRSIRRGDFLVSNHTPANVSEFEVAWIRQPVSLSEIWERIKDEKSSEAAKKAGWNIDVLRKVATRIHKGVSASTDHSDWLEVERDMRTQSLALSESHGPVDEVHQYVKEFDGKIAHYVFYPKYMSVSETAEPGGDNEFAFDDFDVEKRPNSFDEVMACIFFEVGFDGLFHEVRGFGVKNYDLATAQNRLKSRFVDRTLIDGLNFRSLAEGRKPNLDIVNIGPFNVFPAGFEQIPQYPSGQTIGDAIAMLDNQTSHNNARYRDQSKQIQDSSTATQANILANLQAQVDVANATLYLTQVGHVLKTQFERLRRRSPDPDAKLFRKRCIADGVPEEVLDKIEVTVKTGANPGAASSQLRAQVAERMMQLIGTPGVNPRWPLATYVSSTLGANEVEKALVPEQAASQSDGQIREAMMENTHMGEGQELPVDQHDLHHIHIPTHLGPIEAMLQTYQETQQVDPQQLLALQTVFPHLEAHFQYLKMDEFRKGDFQQLWPRYQALASIAEQLMSRIQEIQDQMDATGEMPGQASQIQQPNAQPNPQAAVPPVQ